MTAMCLFKKIIISMFLYFNLNLLHLRHLLKKKKAKKKKGKPKPESPKYYDTALGRDIIMKLIYVQWATLTHCLPPQLYHPPPEVSI